MGLDKTESVNFYMKGISSVFADVAILLGGVVASRYVHLKMLNAILKTALTFYDTTPVGRILSRFSKDIDLVDQELPGEISAVIFFGLQVISGLILALS